MRRARRLLLIIAVLVILACAIVIVGKAYLDSNRGAALLASRLQAIYGGKVELAHADVGTASTTLTDVRLHEVGPDEPDAPWAVVPLVQADLGAWDVIRGADSPSHLNLSQAAVAFRFDERGNLLTQLPASKGGSLPIMAIQNGTVTLRQEGRAEFVVHGVEAELHTDGDGLVVSGTTSDPTWGKWELTASFHRQGGESSLTLKTTGMHLSQPMLDSLPFVAPSVWREVQLEGNTPVELTVRFTPTTGEVHYRTAFEPKATKVQVTSIDLHAEDASGIVVVENGVVQLRDVRGKSADGEITTAANMDFHSQPQHLRFQVGVNRLDLQKLPKSWGVTGPQIQGGRLTGQAELRVTLAQGKSKISGQGQGLIRDVRIFGLPAQEVPLKLVPGETGFQFVPQVPPLPPESRFAPALLLVKTALLSGAVEEPSLSARIIRLLQEGLVGAGRLVIESVIRVAGWLPRVTRTPTHLEAALVVTDVDVVQLFRNMQVPPPFPIAGRASLNVQVGIPIGTSKDLKTYRVHGTVRFTWLRLADLELVQAGARIDYRDGVLQVEELSGLVPGGDPPGTLDGRVRLELMPLGDLSGRLSLRDIPSSTAVSLFGSATDAVTGTFSASVAPRVPLARFREVAAWQATGTFTSDQVRLFGESVTNLAGTVRLQNGLLSVEAVEAIWQTMPLTASGQPTLAAPYRFEAKAQLQRPDGAAPQRLSLQSLPQTLAGRFAARADLQGTLSPPMLRTTGTGTADDLRLGGVPVGHAQLRWEGNADKVDYQIDGEILAGRLHLDGSLPGGEGRLRIEHARLSRLGQALQDKQLTQHLQGNVDVELLFHHEGPQAVPIGKGRLALNRLRWDDTELADLIQGDLDLTPQGFRVRTLTGMVGHGVLRGSLVYDLANRNRRGVALNVQGADAKLLLLPWPALASRIEGQVDVRLRAHMGREWHGTVDAVMAHGTVLGIEVTEWHVPIVFEGVPAQGRGHLEIRDSQANVERGMAHGEVAWSWGDETRLAGKVSFSGVDMRQLLHSWSENTPIAGQLSGRIDFAGNNIHSGEDLTASADMTLQQAQLLNLPIFRQLAPYIAPSQPPSATFSSGQLRARLARGVVRVERLWLEGPFARTGMEGTVDLQGRVALDVAANPTLGLGSLLPLRRLVHLRVDGTLRTPDVRIVPGPVLTEGLLRSLLN